jgi:hypothetical protein
MMAVMTGGRRVKLLVLGCMLVAAMAGTVAAVHFLPAGPATAQTAARAAAALHRSTPAPAGHRPQPHASPQVAGGAQVASGALAGGTVTAHGGGPGSPVADLSELTPVQEYNVSRVSDGPVRIGATTYADSVRFTCDSGSHDSSGDLDYVVTGYGSMTATVGIPADDTRAAADTMTVSFFNNGSGSQVSGPVTVTLGHPQQVRMRFHGSSQLEISCGAVDAAQSAKSMDLALGNATIGPS